MSSYTIAMIGLVALFAMLDMFLHTRLMFNKKFWLMQLFVCIMIIAFDAFAGGRIWQFNPADTLGIYLLNTPLENLLFGCSLIGINIVLFEHDIATHDKPN